MKKPTLIILFTFICVFTSNSQNNDEKQAIAMLRTFYRSYMSAFSINDPKLFQNNLKELREKYLTDRGKKEYKKLIEETDSDPIIKAQDGDVKWAKTLSIKRDLKKPNLYILSYSNDEYGDDGKLHKNTTTISLFVINQNGSYKIDHFL